MNTKTGEIKPIEDVREQVFKETGIKPPSKIKKLWSKGIWWIVCKVKPTPIQIRNGVKGHHPCLCGSGKKFRNCCRTFRWKQSKRDIETII